MYLGIIIVLTIAMFIIIFVSKKRTTTLEDMVRSYQKSDDSWIEELNNKEESKNDLLKKKQLNPELKNKPIPTNLGINKGLGLEELVKKEF